MSHAEQVARLGEGGATFIQLREKHLSPREFYLEAQEALRVAHAHGIRLIINDRVDIALALRADGVHLGQEDLSPEAARRILGAEAIIGFSTHNLEQAREAASLPVDYIAIGPIFNTSSKENPDPAVGLDGLSRVRAATGAIPLIAIGGITPERAKSVLDTGANSIACIATLLAQPTEITERTQRFIQAISA